MAGKIKKGFTTYLMILFIALVAAFLICVTVMLFSPFKNILGFQYFFYEDEYYEYNVKGGNVGEIFDMSKIEEIKINCDYAKVAIERYDLIDNHAIQIINKTKGFARDDQDTSFAYELSYEDENNKILKIEVKEPEGFLYFSKDVTICVLVPTKSDYALENTKINITNTSGNIYLGNNGKVNLLENNHVNPKKLSVKTNSGKILFNEYMTPLFTDLFVKSAKGDIEFLNEGILVVENNLEIHSQSGKLNFKDISCGSAQTGYANDAIIDIGNSKFNCNSIKGNILLSVDNGYFTAEKIEGNIVSNDANSQMGGATIYVKEIEGAVSFPFANKSNITFDKMATGSELFVNSISGNVVVGDTNGKVYVETINGDVKINTYSDDIQIKTLSGDIEVVYNSTIIANQLDFQTQKGNIDLKVQSSLAFQLVVYNSELQLRENGVYVEGLVGEFTNPLTINNGNKKIVIISDKNVNIGMI